MKYYLDTEFLEGPQQEGSPIFGWVCNVIGLFLGVIGVIFHDPILLVAAGGICILAMLEFQKLLKPSKPTIDLISIGIVCEDGRELYLISKEFNLKEAWNRWQQRTGQGDRNRLEPKEYWLRENVLMPIWEELSLRALEDGTDYPENNQFTYKHLKWFINKYGYTNAEIAVKVKEFVGTKETILNWEQVKDIINPQFYGYYADYDWVVFCWLFGTMNHLPDGFPYFCIDLNQMLGEKAAGYFRDRTLAENLSYIENRDDFPKQDKRKEHNALEDARWNKELHVFLENLKV